MKQKQRATIFLKIVTILLGISTLALGLFWLPDMANRDAVAHLESAYLSYLLCLLYVFPTTVRYIKLIVS
ncbi:hypothetical protein MHI04_09865 [Lysinibacillus sp. FSL K6-1151]|uniref:hypothetical protein n=1 Tax=Lysinibacillus sp. FSL K6-1151 TaxID=2921465 RepID=UPI00315AC4F6